MGILQIEVKTVSRVKGILQIEVKTGDIKGIPSD